MRQLGRTCNVGIVIDIVQLLHYMSITCAICLLQLTVSRMTGSGMQKTLSISITACGGGDETERSRLQSGAQRLESPAPSLASQFNAVIETRNDQKRENG